MHVIAFMSQKGGSGKTTLAVHTAVAAEEHGQATGLFDIDPQQSATVWSRERESATPRVYAVNAMNLQRKFNDAYAERPIILAIIDTPPHTAAASVTVAHTADLIVIPVRPSLFDLAAVEASVRIAEAAGTRAVFVLSACPTRAPEIEQIRSRLESYRFPVSPVDIHERRSFARAVTHGYAVTEFDSHGKAAEEVRGFWTFLVSQIDLKEEKNGRGK